MSGAAFRACFVIPIFDHGESVRGVVEALAPHGLPVFIVDDGSGEATQTELARLAVDFPQVRVHRLARNSGKGAAVMCGLQLARATGMSHALQIDADGQHDARDIPRFLERGVTRPDALILGAPLFDASAPRGRVYGRKLTNFWVCVETLSFSIRDTQCGFRLYPLAAVCSLLKRSSLPRRMAFDIAVVVRLAWQGVPVENLPTRVAYPRGGLSHFDMLRDNVRISLVHTGLVLGMLARLPRLVARRLKEANS
jgi:glycosyltransferase involved in cell wall biosynthesis